jgi:ferredoxin
LKIEILRDKCIGSGNCVVQNETLFSQSDDDGKVLLPNGDETDDTTAVDAAMVCPVGAILINGQLP